jgi:hypothetical protein
MSWLLKNNQFWRHHSLTEKTNAFWSLQLVDAKQTTRAFVRLRNCFRNKLIRKDKKTLTQHKALCQDSQLGELIKDCSLVAQQSFLSRQATQAFR